MVNITLKSEKGRGFDWFVSNGCYVCGYAYINGKYSEGNKLLDYFYDVDNEIEFKNKILNLNGIYAVIILSGDRIMAAVDRYGVFKLFYYHNDNDLYIGDSAIDIVNAAGLSVINKDAEKDWIYAGFAAKNETLIQGLNSLNASKFLSFDGLSGLLQINRYHEFCQNPSNAEYKDLLSQLQVVFSRVMKKFISSLDGKKAIIPLSGGVDSRFVALMLKDAGYENVLCFTYGNINGKEERIACHTAKVYGFDYIFIPNKCRDWSRLFKDGENLKYVDFTSQYKAVPHFSDLFAARTLSQIVEPDDCVIVPGHIGSVAESLLEEGKSYFGDEFIKLLILKYFYYYGLNNKEINCYLKESLNIYYKADDNISAVNGQSLLDNAAYDTYRSNHLFMALKPYEFYGFRYRLPLMDNELVDFFKKVPLKFKGKNKILLTDFVTNAVEDDPGVFMAGQSYFSKVAKNLRDKRYCCIKPLDVFKLRKIEHDLPRIHRVLYRYYRNYLSYTAAKTLRYVLRRKDNEKD